MFHKVYGRVGQNHIYIIYIYGVCTVFLAGKSPNIRLYTVYTFGSGQPYVWQKYKPCMVNVRV